jgi:2-keto-4-pentenoate hydratase
MTIAAADIDEIARALLYAEHNRAPIDTLSGRYAGLDEADAYAIARAKLQLRNRRTMGYKLGYTSAAMRQQMNIDHPNYGVLTDDMSVAAGRCGFGSLIHPLVEPEIAIQLERSLAGGGHDRDSVIQAGVRFMPAIEICDTRYREYEFKAVDNIADNSSGARFVLGAPSKLKDSDDLRLANVFLWRDGELLDQGVGANALDDPLLAVAWLANRLNEEGMSLNAGEVVLTGGLTRGYLAQRGQTFVTELADFGSVILRFD